MKNLLLVLVCLSLTGCTSLSGTRRLQKETSDLKESVLKKDEEIKLKDGQLNQKDLEISKLRKQLESLGVFH
jgi:outer membrane biogenesis lipoprotein LolB